jgi:hypothetical protein
MKSAFPTWIQRFALAALGAATVLSMAPLVERSPRPACP